MDENSLTHLFCDVDDFFIQFQKKFLSHIKKTRIPGLSPSEIMTILIWFHASHFRNFKHFYLWVYATQKQAFPKLVSYNRFVQLIPSVLLHANSG